MKNGKTNLVAMQSFFGIFWVAQGTRFCTLPFFLCVIICNNYFMVKFIKMYSLIFTWIVWSIKKNENLVLPIWIEKNFEQRIYFCPLKLHVKNSRFFLSYFLKKDEWPKAYAGPTLLTLLRIRLIIKSYTDIYLTLLMIVKLIFLKICKMQITLRILNVSVTRFHFTHKNFPGDRIKHSEVIVSIFVLKKLIS